MGDWVDHTHGHRPPGVLPPDYGQSMIVKTPEDGIDARDGTTLHSASCIKCVAAETATPGEKTLHETDEELVVYNFEDAAVDGDSFVNTVLSFTGTRYVEQGGGGIHWGKLDANLEYDDTTGVTVSIWEDTPLADSTRNIDNVLPPPWLTEGQFDSGAWVVITRIDGKWYANAGEVETVITDFRVDTATMKLQVKTRKIIVFPVGDESGWTDKHTGTAC